MLQRWIPIAAHTISNVYTWVFPKIGVPQNGWFIVEHPIKMEDLGVSLFLEIPIYIHIYIYIYIYIYYSVKGEF